MILALIVLATNLAFQLLADKIVATVGPAALQITGKTVGILFPGLAV